MGDHSRRDVRLIVREAATLAPECELDRKTELAGINPARSVKSSASSDHRSPNSSADHTCCIPARLRQLSSRRPYGSKTEHVTSDGQNAQLRGQWAMLKVRIAVMNGTFNRDHAAAEWRAKRPYHRRAA